MRRIQEEELGLSSKSSEILSNIRNNQVTTNIEKQKIIQVLWAKKIGALIMHYTYKWTKTLKLIILVSTIHFHRNTDPGDCLPKYSIDRQAAPPKTRCRPTVALIDDLLPHRLVAPPYTSKLWTSR